MSINNRCDKCNEKPIYKTKSLSLCKGHFNEYIFGKVARVLKKYTKPSTKKLLALSGGKDSSVLFYILLKLNYDFAPIYIDFGFSEKNTKFIAEISSYFKKDIIIIKDTDYQIKIKKIIKNSNSNPCVICSTARRHILNDYAYKNGFEVILTAHNLTDIVNQAFNNIKNNFILGFKNTTPYLSSNTKLVSRLKPLYFVTELESKIFAQTNKIPYFKSRCKYFKGFFFKKYINGMEKEDLNILLKMGYSLINFSKIIEGIKNEKISDRFCKICGYLSSNDICSFCRILCVRC
jgi:tRNA(Ile)-lysidine synthase TilS/MesJ